MNVNMKTISSTSSTNSSHAASERMVEQLAMLSIAPPSRAKFLGLPGEIRNQIYNHLLTDKADSYTQTDVNRLSRTCHQLRFDLRTLYLKHTTFVINLYHLRAFLVTNFPIASPEVMQTYRMHVEVDVCFQWVSKGSDMDLLPLITHVLKSPGVSLHIEDADAWVEEGITREDAYRALLRTLGLRHVGEESDDVAVKRTGSNLLRYIEAKGASG
ncbi:hypothetical protein NX059_005548 [Plenodomus lindquistii]|nr:hypothetical protein NX059_005548 [Plenodomus lindquistii]